MRACLCVRMTQAQEAARVMWFERLYCWLRFFERNVLYPAVFLGALTQSAYEMRKEKQFSLRYDVLSVWLINRFRLAADIRSLDVLASSYE